jgi:hypothetical protein
VERSFFTGSALMGPTSWLRERGATGAVAQNARVSVLGQEGKTTCYDRAGIVVRRALDALDWLVTSSAAALSTALGTAGPSKAGTRHR